MAVVENRIIHRIIYNISEYEEGGQFARQVIPLNTQAYAVYEKIPNHEDGLFYVFGDDVHTYVELRDNINDSIYREYKVLTLAELNQKANKSTTLAGYEITDAYTKEYIDSNIQTKLTDFQQQAVDSTITKEKVDSYNIAVAKIDKKLDANKKITPNTNTKITYDENGLIISSDSLSLNDLPENIPTSKIVGLDKYAEQSTTYTKDEVNELLKNTKPFYSHKNVSVGVSQFTIDTTYPDFPIVGKISLPYIQNSMVPEVIFSAEDALSGNYLPIAESFDGYILIYCKKIPEKTLVIPTITYQ